VLNDFVQLSKLSIFCELVPVWQFWPISRVASEARTVLVGKYEIDSDFSKMVEADFKLSMLEAD
jgi:hypothetical protein